MRIVESQHFVIYPLVSLEYKKAYCVSEYFDLDLDFITLPETRGGSHNILPVP